jgi:hypothetical protein
MDRSPISLLLRLRRADKQQAWARFVAPAVGSAVPRLQMEGLVNFAELVIP